MKYLLDTTWIIVYLRGNPDVVNRLHQLDQEELAVSIISVAELYEGVFRSRSPLRNEQSLKEFLQAVTVLDLTEDVCRTYGEQKVKLLRTGTVIGGFDLLIAATALVHDLTLLTKDQDFKRVGDLSLNIV